MSTQVVRPAGAGHETLWVLLTAAVVLVLAAIVVGVRGQPQAAAALAPPMPWTPAPGGDARTQLNAVEQGVHGDLLVAAEEIEALAEGARALPAVEALRDMDLPPFADGVTASTRGGHSWKAVTQGPFAAYIGRTAAPDVAASFLLRLPAAPAQASPSADHDHADDAVQVWVQREGPQAWPAPLDDAALTRQGWRQVVARYDAGVTRKGAAH